MAWGGAIRDNARDRRRPQADLVSPSESSTAGVVSETSTATVWC